MSNPRHVSETLALLGDGLAGLRGQEYWRRLEELAQRQGLAGFLEQEFDHDASATRLSRRRFLTLLGASMGLAGLQGCDIRPPLETIVPFVRAPEAVVPGVPQWYATARTLGGLAMGLLVESHEGRPTKIEGNPKHPASLGATDVFAQADVLTLYDPDRSQTVLYRGQISSWDRALSALQAKLSQAKDRSGFRLRLLTETTTSPTLIDQIGTLLKQYPTAKWHQYDPIGGDAARGGSLRFFGRFLNTCYRFEQADVVLSLDADFLATGPNHVRHARDFIERRRASIDAGIKDRPQPSRLYMVQCSPTGTGAKADHLWALRPSQVEAFARALAASLDDQVKSAIGPPERVAISESQWKALLDDLQKHRGRGIVIAGPQQPASVHALAHAINHALGNVGQTVYYTRPVEGQPSNQLQSLQQLTDDLNAGQVDLLVILGGNPVYTAPADVKFAEALDAGKRRGVNKDLMRVRLGTYYDETSFFCDWHIPEAHFLESWSDVRAFDGAASIIQPLIAPLYQGKTAHELLGALMGGAKRSGYETVRHTWRRFWQEHGSGQGAAATSFDEYWELALHEGVLPGTAFPQEQVAAKQDWQKDLPQMIAAHEAGGQSASDARGATKLELILRPDPSVLDGRYANNGWLQELPKPITKLTWGNAAIVSPATAKQYGVTTFPSGHGGQRGQATADVVSLSYGGRTLTAPVWISPDQPDGAVTLHLGFGRHMAGNVGNGVGVNAYLLQTSASPWAAIGVELRHTQQQALLACTQYGHWTEGRNVVRYVMTSHPDELREPRPTAEAGSTPGDHAEHLPSLYPRREQEGYQWSMVIDLAACVGCNACVIACQAENNIPVIGKDQVMRGRAMHWLRIDNYREEDAEGKVVRRFFEPVPCMHCENAPCEVVCPVYATVHSSDGLNDMVYNRCVGTRYCSNNCPYKVRRFNYLQYADYKTETFKLLHNPDVTVRSRGVMEKCTYCVQRIREAEITAETEDRRIRDGEVQTACQAACPARAIFFGDLADPQSTVQKWRQAARRFDLLGDLNTRPRTSYLGAMWNPNPDIETA